MTINRMNHPSFIIGKTRWDEFRAGYQGTYDLSVAVYVGQDHKVDFICPTHGPMQMGTTPMMRGAQCQKCAIARRKGTPRVTQKKCLARFIEVHGDRYDYSLAQYTGQNNKVKIICKQHGEFEQVVRTHWEGHGCRRCSYDRSTVSQYIPREEVISRIEQASPGKFKVVTQGHLPTHSKMEVECLQHGGVYPTTPKRMMRGQNPCKICFGIGAKARGVAMRMPREEQLNKIEQVFPGKFKVVTQGFTLSHSSIELQCLQHGTICNTTPNSILAGRNPCGVCNGIKLKVMGEARRRPYTTMVSKIEQIFPGNFEVLTQEFTPNHSKMGLQCLHHGIVCRATPHGMLIDKCNPCPSCSNKKSKGEQAVADFLSVFTPIVQRDRTLIAPKELDIYLPDHKIAVEFCGEYWHSVKSKEEEKEGRLKHYNKYMACKAIGIRLITIWAEEWEQRQPQIQRLLRNAMGKSKGKLMARKCDLRKVPTPEARVFYDKHHPQGGAGGGVHYGLYWKDVLVACQRFAFGANDRGSSGNNRQWTLGRYATRVSVSGGSSRLFKAFLADEKPTLVKSFSDNRFFVGGMYIQLGFILEVDVKPDYTVWSPRIGIKPKPHYQRRALQARLIDHNMPDIYTHETDPRTEAEMTFLMGCGRLYDCGKKRWIWTGQTPPNGV